MNRLLQDLNDAQYKAVETTEGPLLIVAGAGSGKTRVLTRRLAYILTERKAEPYQILAVTFTNKAAGEMKERVAQLLGGDIPGMNVSTFHSFCARLLRQEAEALGYDNKFTIFDAADSVTLIKNCIKEMNLSTTQFVPKAQLRKISNAKNQFISENDFAIKANGYFETTTAKLFSYYQERLRKCNAMDFDDLLYNAVLLLKNNEEIGNRYRNRFKYVLVDEYQDTNHVQYQLLRTIVGDHNNICVVGDEDQSIYGWRGADIRNILDFEKDFPGAKVIKLELNYRSTDVILKAASSVIKNNEARKDKTLYTNQTGGENISHYLVDSAKDEAVAIIGAINNKRGEVDLRETVILYRTNAQSRPFEEELRRHNMPYQIIGGISFYQRKEIKDIMAYLKLIVNVKDDVSFQRTINYPKRGIGQKTLEDIAIHAQRNGAAFYEVIQKIKSYPELSKQLKKSQPFVDLIEKYRMMQETVPIDQLAAELIEDLNLLEGLRSEDEITGQTRVENIEVFIEGMSEFARANTYGTLADYLAEISLFTDIDNYADTDEKLTLMTIHTAKGLEYDVVYLVGLEEGLFPLQRSIAEIMELEEERRLFYVGATRARKKLVLSSATTRFRFGEVTSTPSRFIKEIPANLIDQIDRRNQYKYQSTFAGKQKGLFDLEKAEPVIQGEHYEFEGHEAYKPGRIVHHPSFGRGKIIKAEGFGESLTLQINFAGLGLKKIMVKYAKIKVIG
ncbi:MAG: UvrD-helicase domain-containing protein [bacterium]